MKELTTDFILSLGFGEVAGPYPDHFVLPILGGYLYLRPSYRGGFYWGICSNSQDIDNPTELAAVEPIQSEERLVKLIEGMMGCKLTIANK